MYKGWRWDIRRLIFRRWVWLKIPWPKCKEGRFPTFHVCGIEWRNSRTIFLEGWRDFRACLNAGGCTTSPLINGEGGGGKWN